MNIQDSHIAFKIEADKNAVNIGMSGCPSFLPEEVDYWLYSAYLSKIATKVTGNNNLQVPFEGNIKRVSDLEGLVKTDKGLSLLAETGTNKIFLNDFKSTITYGTEVQEKRMYFISAMLKFGNPVKTTTVELISHKDGDRFLQTYNNKPWIPNPVAVLENNRLYMYIDQDIVTGPYTIDLTYLAYPKRLNNLDITSGMDEIPEYMQYDVIKLAASMALENIESQRTQTHPNMVQISE